MPTLSTSYDVESGVSTRFKTGINGTQTTGLVLKYALTITSGVLLVARGKSNTEYISFGSASVSNGETTLGDVVRGLIFTGNTFAGSSSRAYAHSSAESVELVNYHPLINLKANTDRTNTFTAAQTIASGIKLYFGNSNQWIYENGGELYLRSSLQAERSLSQLASLSGSNDKSKVSASDTTEGYLGVKMIAGSGLTSTINNPAGNETFTFDIQLESSDPSLEIVSDRLGLKIKSGGGLAKDANGVYVNTSALTGIAAETLAGNYTYNATIAQYEALYWHGNQRLALTDADAVNTAFLFAGVANAAGVAGDSKQVILPGPVVTVPAFTLADRQNCRLWDGETQSSSNTTSDALSASTAWRCQTYTPNTNEDNISTITLNLTKSGSPTGNATVRIRATSGGLPTGSDLATATLAYSSISSGDNVFTISGGVSVTPGTVYAIILDPGAGVSGGNTIAWNYQNTNVYASGQRCTSSDSGSNWTADSTADYRFKVRYKGIAGEPVYVGNTAGDFVLTPGTYRAEVGVALSTTKIMLTDVKKSIYGTYSTTFSAGTVQTDVTIGFRARTVFWMCFLASGWVCGMTTKDGTVVTSISTATVQATGPRTAYVAEIFEDSSNTNGDGFGPGYTVGISCDIGADTVSFTRVVTGSPGTGTVKFIAIN